MASRPKRPQQPLPLAAAPVPPLATASWKDHPLVVAAGAVAATIALAILLVKEVILPTHTASLNNQLSSLPTLQSENAKLEAKLSEMQRKLDDSQRRLQLAQNTGMLIVGSPYPTGLGKVRVGDNIAELEKHFAPGSIDKSKEGYVSLRVEHGVIEDATYYFDETSKAKLISHISYRLSYAQKFDDLFLQEKLIEALGKPTTNPRGSFYSWKTGLRVTVYKSSSNQYLVMDDSFTPGFWPKR